MHPDRAAPGWVIRARKSDADGRERTACLNLRIISWKGPPHTPVRQIRAYLWVQPGMKWLLTRENDPFVARPPEAAAEVGILPRAPIHHQPKLACF
jgi:hypothetical protein